VRVENLIDIRRRNVSVPYCLGINYDIRPVLALIEASGLVGSHPSLQSTDRDSSLEELVEFTRSTGIAASPRMSRLSLISANENMMIEFRHRSQHIANAGHRYRNHHCLCVCL
jgi:hypothetical protein